MKFSFTIAQFVISVDIPNGYENDFPLGNFKEFITNNKITDATLVINITSSEESLENQRKAEPLLDANYQILNVLKAREKYLNPQPDEQIYLAPNQLIAYNPKQKTFEVFVLASKSVRDFFLPYIFVFASHLLADNSGLLIHGSGFEIANNGSAFIGPSNAGKTTATSLLTPDFLLSDDVIAVTDIFDKPMIHSTPLGGKTDGRREIPLKTLLMPSKSKIFKVTQLNKRQAFLRFMAEHNEYIHKFFKPCIANIFNNAHELFSKIPAFEIEFSIDFINKSEILNILERIN